MKLIKDIDLSVIGKNIIEKEEQILKEVSKFAGMPPKRNAEFGKLNSI